MHELSLMESLADEIDAILKKEGATRVLTLNLDVGELSGVEPDALEFAFPVVAERKASLKKATLNLETTRVEVACDTCGERTNPELPLVECKACGSINVEIVSGREFTIKSMEIE